MSACWHFSAVSGVGRNQGHDSSNQWSVWYELAVFSSDDISLQLKDQLLNVWKKWEERSCEGVFAQEEVEQAGQESGDNEEFVAVRVMFILLKLSIRPGTDFLGKAENTLAFQGCICVIWRCSLGSCSLLLCHQLPLCCTSWKSGPHRLTLQKLCLVIVWHSHELDGTSGVGPCTFPGTFGITVVTGFYFFILKINTYSELAYVFANILLAFFSCCLPSLPPAPLMTALCHGTRGADFC